MNHLYSYYQSWRTILSILNFQEGIKCDHKIEKKNYDGFDSLNPPVKIISPIKDNNKIIILYPGASPHAENHPQMEMLGIALANNGYKVFIPRIPPLKILDISSVNIKWFVCFYKWLLDEYKYDKCNVNLVGISYGGGLMLKTAYELGEYIEPSQTLMTYGTFFDARAILDFLVSGEIKNDGLKYKIKPHEWGLIVIFKNYLKNLNLDWDISGVQKVLELHIQDKIEERDKIVSKLSLIQKEFVISIINSEANVEIMRLSKEIVENETKALKELSPKYWCHEIQNKVFVFHGANDSMVPFTESEKLADHLPNSELLISYIYEHKEIATNKGIMFKLKELVKMASFFSKLYYNYEN